MSVILIVDDNEALADFTRLSLETALPKSHVLTAGGYQEALLLLERVEPDVVVLDRRLPDGDGLDLCEEILLRFPGARAVLASAAWTADQRQRAWDNNVVAILEKPYDVSELVNAVQAVSKGSDPSSTDPREGVGQGSAGESATRMEGVERTHQIRNRLSALLAGVRALGADLRAELPDSLDLVDEYEPRLVNIILELSSLLESPVLFECTPTSAKGGAQ